MKTPKKIKAVKWELELHTSFQFSQWQNLVNVTMALSQAGYFINIRKVEEFYQLNVYKVC